jgi:hypothetical protein
MIKRTFPGGLEIPVNQDGADALANIVEVNRNEGVTWVNSFVSDDRTRTYCVYDGPDRESIRRAAESNGLPVDEVDEVRVLDPYFYLGADR